MIGLLNYLIKLRGQITNCWRTTFLASRFVENWSSFKAITIEEIVILVIKSESPLVSLRASPNLDLEFQRSNFKSLTI